MAPRLRSLSVRGFRAFGAAEQTLNLPSDIAVVWGPNSKGKTSLAEALEFLLTGRIARRELMASTQDEFADALRNAHLAEAEDAYVVARILTADGKVHEVKRTLTRDYGKRQDCASRLEIDGVETGAQGLTALGIVLSQPPLEAPVLAQHTLGYLFTAGPQERATYFKAILELTDLDRFRNAVAALSTGDGVKTPLLTKLETCAGIMPFGKELARLRGGTADVATVEAVLSDAARLLLEETGQAVADGLPERIAQVETTLADRRRKALPVHMLDRTEPGAWSGPDEREWDPVRDFVLERAKTERRVQQLVTLFEQALRLPEVETATGNLDCPLCDAKSSLTPARIVFLREQVQRSRAFTSAERAARDALTRITTSVRGLARTAAAALPKVVTTERGQRRAEGFSTVRMRDLLGAGREDKTRPWLAVIRPLLRAVTRLRSEAERVVALLEGQTSDLANLDDSDRIIRAVSGLAGHYSELRDSSRSYEAQVAPLREGLEAVLDVRADTRGWQDLIDLASDPGGLHTAVTDRAARESVRKEIEKTVREIDGAKERVLEDKFGEYSSLVQAWWERLRPGEATFFETVKPRKGAKRTIDIKVGLSPHEDRLAPKLRDAIAVFSQSQIHCLGLALFLARAEHEACGFILLDDPVLSSDEDYRVHFHTEVLEAILGIPMQVVILTQSHPTWGELESRYRHANISQAQLLVDSAAEGTAIEATSDALKAKIGRARSLARSGHPDNRKSCGLHLRDAGERFCKELLVEDRRSNGGIGAEISEYDGKTLEWLFPRIAPMLDRDPSHPGKFEAFKAAVNRACHDNSPPSSSEMVHACGDIDRFVKDYLGR
ncbi:MAG: AAA family ATPase [Planctomycetota bacterium]